MFRKVTGTFALALMNGIVWVLTIGFVPPEIVRVTGIWTSVESPESSTVTSKARFVLATTGSRWVVESSVPLGRAFVETMFVPCSPPVVRLPPRQNRIQGGPRAVN